MSYEQKVCDEKDLFSVINQSIHCVFEWRGLAFIVDKRMKAAKSETHFVLVSPKFVDETSFSFVLIILCVQFKCEENINQTLSTSSKFFLIGLKEEKKATEHFLLNSSNSGEKMKPISLRRRF